MLPILVSTRTDLKRGLGQMRREIDELGELLGARHRDRACREIKYQLAALRFETALIRHAHVCGKAGFNPDEPRIPAGNPDGGQWTAGGAGFSPGGAGFTPRYSNAPARKPASYQFAARGSQSAAYCWNQMQIDMLYCSTLRPTIIRACRAQAMERYAACLAGKPLPPLPF